VNTKQKLIEPSRIANISDRLIELLCVSQHKHNRAFQTNQVYVPH